ENCHDSLRAAGGAAFSIEGLAEERLVIVQEVQSREVLDPVDVTLAIRRALVECHEVQPYVVVLVEPWSIPRTTSGKIRRRDCRKAFLEGSLRVIHEWRDAKGVESTNGTASHHRSGLLWDSFSAPSFSRRIAAPNHDPKRQPRKSE